MIWSFLIFQKAIEVEAIVLDQKEDIKFDELWGEDLPKMRHLELLILYDKNFLGMPEFLSNSLRYFSWNGYPFSSLPSNFHPYNLVEMNMPNSSIEQLWIGIQVFSMLLKSHTHPPKKQLRS